MASTPEALGGQVVRREPLRAAYFWLLFFMVIYYARPEDWIPGLAILPLAKIAGGLVLLAFVLSLGQIRRRMPREIIYLILLVFQLWLTVPFSPVWRGGAFRVVLDFSKLLPLLIVMYLAVGSMTRLRGILFVQAAAVAAITIASIVKAHFSGGRLEGMISGTYANSNDLALAIAVCLPICLALLLRTRSVWRKCAWALAMLGMVYGVFLTASRGGALALLAAAVVCLWQLGIRGRRGYLIPIAAVVGIAFWVSTGGSLRQRFDNTLTGSQANVQSEQAYSSAQARWSLLVQSLKITGEHPLFGVGPGNFEIVSGIWHVTHNSFTQMSSEGGIPAFILYVLILWRALVNLRAVRRLRKSGKEIRLFSMGLEASLAAYLVGSLFASEAYQFFPYFLVAYTTALYRAGIQVNAKETARAAKEFPAVPVPSTDGVSEWADPRINGNDSTDELGQAPYPLIERGRY